LGLDLYKRIVENSAWVCEGLECVTHHDAKGLLFIFCPMVVGKCELFGIKDISFAEYTDLSHLAVDCG
jgi:hypothetical protein